MFFYLRVYILFFTEAKQNKKKPANPISNRWIKGKNTEMRAFDTFAQHSQPEIVQQQQQKPTKRKKRCSLNDQRTITATARAIAATATTKVIFFTLEIEKID